MLYTLVWMIQPYKTEAVLWAPTNLNRLWITCLSRHWWLHKGIKVCCHWFQVVSLISRKPRERVRIPPNGIRKIIGSKIPLGRDMLVDRRVDLTRCWFKSWIAPNQWLMAIVNVHPRPNIPPSEIRAFALDKAGYFWGWGVQYVRAEGSFLTSHYNISGWPTAKMC